MSLRIGATDPAAVFYTVVDILLHISFITNITAVVAIIDSWKSKVVRNLLPASLFFLSFEFLIPIFFFQFIQNGCEMDIDSWIRLIPSGVGSGLALIGKYYYYGY